MVVNYSALQKYTGCRSTKRVCMAIEYSALQKQAGIADHELYLHYRNIKCKTILAVAIWNHSQLLKQSI
jgi:hypothetical protein